MKLRRIKLNDNFRSLRSGFELYFSTDSSNAEFNPYCVVGRNGSGKSNILELLGAIFYSLELRCLNFIPAIYEEFDLEKQSPNAYELEYTINNAHITITKEASNLATISKDGNTLQSQQELKAALPHSIIGYSSGENEILSLPFFKMRFIQYDEYLSYLSNDINYSAPESGLVYLDDTFSQAIFLCNFIFSDEEAVSIFKNDLKIKSVKQFRIVIKKHHFEEMSEEYQNSADDHDQTELTTGLKKQIDKLISCSTLHYDNEQTQGGRPEVLNVANNNGCILIREMTK